MREVEGVEAKVTMIDKAHKEEFDLTFQADEGEIVETLIIEERVCTGLPDPLSVDSVVLTMNETTRAYEVKDVVKRDIPTGKTEYQYELEEI